MGHVQQDDIVIDMPIGDAVCGAFARRVFSKSALRLQPEAKQLKILPAKSAIKVAKRGYFFGTAIPVSFIHVQLFTGRTHQIRVHLYHIGHPILGDAVYNDINLAQFVPEAARDEDRFGPLNVRAACSKEAHSDVPGVVWRTFLHSARMKIVFDKKTLGKMYSRGLPEGGVTKLAYSCDSGFAALVSNYKALVRDDEKQC